MLHGLFDGRGNDGGGGRGGLSTLAPHTNEKKHKKRRRKAAQLDVLSLLCCQSASSRQSELQPLPRFVARRWGGREGGVFVSMPPLAEEPFHAPA